MQPSRSLRLLAGTTAAVVLPLFCAIGGAAGGASDDFKLEEGYVSLFNGRDLTGWCLGKDDLAGKVASADKWFEVVDGVLVANGDREKLGSGILNTTKSYKSFRLKLEYRAEEKAISGVYLHGGSMLRLPDLSRRELKNFRTNDWNELDVTVTSDVVHTSVNGKALAASDNLVVAVAQGKVEAKLNGQTVDVAKLEVSLNAVGNAAINGDKLTDPMLQRLPNMGPIGLRRELKKFEFRRIRVKELL
jgi:hypothetical protein